jgi:hypothetical protein
LVNDELRQLIRDYDECEPAEDDFGFRGHQNTPNLTSASSSPPNGFIGGPVPTSPWIAKNTRE